MSSLTPNRDCIACHNKIVHSASMESKALGHSLVSIVFVASGRCGHRAKDERLCAYTHDHGPGTVLDGDVNPLNLKLLQSWWKMI